MRLKVGIFLLHCRWVMVFGWILACQPAIPPSVQDAMVSLPDQLDYNFDIQPILSEHCYPCHGPDENTREADLRLDVREGAVAKSSDHSRFIIKEGDPEASELIRRIFSSDPELMMPPPDAKLELSAEKKAILYQWIDDGVEWKPHWAYMKPVQVTIPAVKAQDWPANEIDHFILEQIEKKAMQPSPRASKATLIRRVYLDLIGLPPRLRDVDAFLNDDSEHAFEKVVDQLMRSDRFGEKWTWDWLDASRYADTNGFQGDPERKMWPWRDWVIAAINDNMPYDQFSIEQLAGDLLPGAQQEQILATAFNRNHMYNGEGGRIPEETRVENVFDRTETVGTLWLGMTLNCCRCHDHKFDQISQKEYYEFSDFFNQTSEAGIGYNGRIKPILDLSSTLERDKVREIEKFVNESADALYDYEKIIFPRGEDLAAAESEQAKNLDGDNLFALGFHPIDRNPYYLGLLSKAFQNRDAKYYEKINILRQAIGKKDKLTADNLQVMVMDHLSRPRPTYILDRGVYDKRGDQVSAGVPEVVCSTGSKEPTDRLELAKWLVGPEHPLTGRVVVNRFWQAIFGKGLVDTPDDFGVQGAKPSHPALLDWLARDFVDHGWDVKRLIKQMVMSATYQQTSKIDTTSGTSDINNKWLARAHRHRLPSWMIRDQALFLSHLLSDSIGGPSVKPYQPPGIWEEATFGKKTYVQDHGEDLYRRTLYTFWRRIVGPTTLFDNSPRQTCSVKPLRTNTPMHALTTLNDITYQEAARVMAAYLLDTSTPGEEILTRAFRMATSRFPNEVEKEILEKRWKILKNKYENDPLAAQKIIGAGEYPVAIDLDPITLAALSGICSLILNLDEVICRQ